ncbi:MAG: LysR family transcriptional regulator, partial [Mycolicibacterium sp.]|nr:LysR family transcriptional regulator [Mycolicibacterium sp.]
LLEERHVSRDADRVRLSQPAMSRALQRLRRHFGDELLVRGPEGYSLTPRAERIRDQLATAVTHLEQLFTTEMFDPAAAAQSFRLAVSDYTVSTFGPALVRTILTQSPNSAVSCEVLDAHAFDKLDAWTLDLVIYGRAAPDRYRSQRLFTDRFVCVVAAEHPLAHQTSVSLSKYLRWPHLTIEVDQPWIDRALEALGTSRRIAVSMPYAVLGPSILPGTEMVMTIPAQLAHHYADRARTRVLAAPRELGELQFYAVWHPRLDMDPSHSWLRKVVRTVTAPSSPRRRPASKPAADK